MNLTGLIPAAAVAIAVIGTSVEAEPAHPLGELIAFAHLISVNAEHCNSPAVAAAANELIVEIESEHDLMPELTDALTATDQEILWSNCSAVPAFLISQLLCVQEAALIDRSVSCDLIR